jgi:hypothetical protein
MKKNHPLRDTAQRELVHQVDLDGPREVLGLEIEDLGAAVAGWQ